MDFIEMTDEEVAAYEALPETIEWRKWQKRSVSNARLHCEGCGRFVKDGGTQHYYNGQFDCARTHYVCSKCGPGAIEWV